MWMNSSIGEGESFDVGHYKKGFFNALNDDMNIPSALDCVEGLAIRVLKNGGKWTTEAREFMKTAFNILSLGYDG